MIVSEELIARIERSEAERVESSARAFGGDVLRIAGGVAAFCGEGNPTTQCDAIGALHDVSLEDFQKVLEFYRGRCREFEFKLSPISPLELREWVVRRSQSIPEFETILIQDLIRYAPKSVDVDIRQVHPDDYRGHAERSVRRFCGDEGPPGLADLIEASCRSGSVLAFEVFVEGLPVAGCALGLSTGIGWLSGAAVEPEFRGKGLHKAMQTHRLNLLKERGYEIACQGALAGSVSQQNAQKNGFSIAFTRPTFMVDPSSS